MKTQVFSFILILAFVLGDGEREYGEPCSLRSQVANLFRTKDSPEGCISAKGLVCLAHKCTCGDPSDIYEVPQTPEDKGGSTSNTVKQAANSVIGFFRSTSTTTTTIAPKTTSGGRCVGRAGSPCFRTNSTCVQHAACESSGLGSVTVCKCQGLYSSNQSGQCTKTASVLKQALKYGTGGITG